MGTLKQIRYQQGADIYIYIYIYTYIYLLLDNKINLAINCSEHLIKS